MTIKLNYKSLFIALILLVILQHVCYAQGQGEIESVQFEIVTEKKIVLPQASRNFEKVAPRPVEPIKPEITYEFRNLSFKTNDYNPVIRPLRLQNESLAKLYNNYISGGIGNYASPYLSAHLTSKRDRNKFIGASVYHRSFGNGSVDEDFSASSVSQFRLYGNSFGKSITLSGFADYNLLGTYFYGYPVKPAERSSIRQTYSVFSLGGSMSNSENGNFNYRFGSSFSFLNDHLKAKESEVKFNFNSDYAIKRSGNLIVNADYFLMARKDELREAKPRHLLRSTVGYRWSPLDEVTLTVGSRIAYHSDTLGDNKSLHLYPHLYASYEVSKKVEAYATLTGDIDRVSLHTLSNENNWVQANLDIFNTNRAIEFAAGVKGKLGNKVAFHSGTSIANLKNLYFYQNDPANVARFKVYYDTDGTQRVNLFAEMGWMHSTKLKLNVRGDLYSYSSDIVKEIAKTTPFATAVPSESKVALHRPTWRVAGDLQYSIYDKILLSASLITQGGMRAIDFGQSNATTLKVVEIDPAIDLNFGADYLVSKQFSVFLKFNNVLSNEYNLYLNYPVRGFQVLGGVSWSF